MAKNRIERLQVETLTGQYFFRDLYNKDVYFEDFENKSMKYFRLDYDPSFNFHGGKNFIGIRGNWNTMELNSEILIEAIDSNGQLIKTQVYDLNDDAHNRVISIDIEPTTPAGDIIITIIGTATEAPDGSAIPSNWVGVPNFRWTRTFVAKPLSSNKSPIIFNQFSRPSIKVTEIKKPFYDLSFNQELSASVGWTGNTTSSYVLATGVNTECSMSYRKFGGKFYMTAQTSSQFLDFAGFTQDMEGGIVIVRKPVNPRPAAIGSYDVSPVVTAVYGGIDSGYAETEKGDGIFEDIQDLHATSTVPTMSYRPGAYLSTITEVVSPYELRVANPHTTWQGLSAGLYQEFEHHQFDASPFELLWPQAPISYSAQTGSSGAYLNTSYAKVTFDNLEPLTGDVTRIKCYIKNAQAPFDWVLASDNAVKAQELLYRQDHEKHRTPIGDFSLWGVSHNGTASLEQYWETEGIGTTTPSMSIYYQDQPGEHPPVEDSLQIGINTQAEELDGTAFWWLRPKSAHSASFYQDQWYELSFKAISTKTIPNTWNQATANTILEPKLTLYMSGSAFTDGGDDYGKFVGLIEDTAAKKKHVEYDYSDNEKEIGYKFVFKADGTEGGIPCFKIDSGIWQFWDISIKPWDRDGYTPGSWDVIFPTIHCNVGVYDSLDFKFEFYNDYGEIANYTSVIKNIPWENELTFCATNIVTNTVTVSGPATFSNGVLIGGSLSASCYTGSCFSGSNINFTGGPWTFAGPNATTFGGPVTMSVGFSASGPVQMGGPLTASGPSLFNGLTTFAGTSSFTGPVTMSGGLSSSGPNQLGGPVTMSCPVYIPCLTNVSQSNLVNWNSTTGKLEVTSSDSFLLASAGGGGADNLGDHTASLNLHMNTNWISSSKDYGIRWYSSGMTNVKKIYVDSAGKDLYLFNQGTGDTSQIRINNGIGGLTFYTDTTVTSTPQERMRIATDGDWTYTSLGNSTPAAATNNYLSYDTSTGEITYTTSSNIITGGPGGGVSVFTSLTDTPANYSGEEDKYVKVNAGATALEFTDPPSATDKSISIMGSAKFVLKNTTLPDSWTAPRHSGGGVYAATYDQHFGIACDSATTTVYKGPSWQHGGFVVPVDCTMKSCQAYMRPSLNLGQTYTHGNGYFVSDSIYFSVWYTKFADLEMDTNPVPSGAPNAGPLMMKYGFGGVDSGFHPHTMSINITNTGGDVELEAGSIVWPMAGRINSHLNSANNMTTNYLYTTYNIYFET